MAEEKKTVRSIQIMGQGLVAAILGALGIIAAILAGFGRVIAEVGSAIMVGGNIRGYTRTLTTAITLETAKGNFILGLTLGVILLVVAFSINMMVYSQLGRKS